MSLINLISFHWIQVILNQSLVICQMLDFLFDHIYIIIVIQVVLVFTIYGMRYCGINLCCCPSRSNRHYGSNEMDYNTRQMAKHQGTTEESHIVQRV